MDSVRMILKFLSSWRQTHVDKTNSVDVYALISSTCKALYEAR